MDLEFSLYLLFLDVIDTAKSDSTLCVTAETHAPPPPPKILFSLSSSSSVLPHFHLNLFFTLTVGAFYF
jgi:hypothetical protein